MCFNTSYFTNTNLVSEESAEIWDPYGEEWLPSSRTSYNYDGDGNQLARLREAWNAQDEAYINAELVEDRGV